MGQLAKQLGKSLAKKLGKSLAGFEGAQSLIYALRNFSAANYYATQQPGGEAGSTSGFGVAALFRAGTDMAGNVTLVANDNISPIQGHILYLSSTGPVFTIASGVSPAFTDAPRRAIVQSEIGRLFLFVGVYDSVAGRVRSYLDRAEQGAGTVINGYTPSTLAQWLGRSRAVTPLTNSLLLSTLNFRGVPTLANIQALYDAVRSFGDMPRAMDGVTVSHRWSARDALAGLTVVDGQVGPATIADTITGAAADVMTRNGSPTVVTIDPSVDGRKTYGAQGFSTANALQTAAGLGLQGSATGFHGFAVVRFDVQPSGAVQAAMIANTVPPSGVNGLQVSTFGANLRFLTLSGATAYQVTYAVTAADLGVPFLIGWHYTGTHLRLYVRRIQTSVDVAGSFVASGEAMRLGSRSDGHVFPSSIFGLMGGNTNPTVAEIEAVFDDFNRTGKLVPIAGKTEHLWDLTHDITAQGGPELGVPAQVLDRVGSDHLTRVDTRYPLGSFRGLRLVGAGVSQLKASPASGIYGTATALTLSFLISPLALITTGVVASTWVSGSGWYFSRFGTVNTAASLAFALNNVQTTTGSLTADELGTLVHIAFTYDGTTLKTYVNGTERHSAAVAAYTPNTEALTLGNHPVATSTPAPGDTVFFAVGGGAYVATPAEIAAQSAASRAVGRLVAIAGRTDERRHNYDQDVAEQQTDFPATLIERAQGGSRLARIGAPLQPAQRVERVYSWETSPIFYGAASPDINNHWTVADGFAGSPSGWTIELAVKIESMTVAPGTRIVAAKRSPPGVWPGWQFQTTGTNSILAIAIGGASSGAVGSSVVLSAADVGKILLWTAIWDAPAGKLRTVIKRAEVGSGVTFAPAFEPSTSAMYIGRRVDGFSADGITVFGLRAGNFIPTVSEVQAAHDQLMTTERFTADAYPGRTFANLYRFDDASSPATLLDRVGTQHMTKVGSPQVVGQYARAYGW